MWSARTDSFFLVHGCQEYQKRFFKHYIWLFDISPFYCRSFLKESLLKCFIFRYLTVFEASFRKVNFIEVITSLWKSDKPVEKDVVFSKLLFLFVIIKSMELEFSKLLKQVGNVKKFDKKCSSRNQRELLQCPQY